MSIAKRFVGAIGVPNCRGRGWRSERIFQRSTPLFSKTTAKAFYRPSWFRRSRDAARSAGKIVAADPNPRNLVDWRGLTVIKPNRTEAFLAAGISSGDPDTAPSQDADLKRAGETLLKNGKQKYVLITLGEHGMMLFQEKRSAALHPDQGASRFSMSRARAIRQSPLYPSVSLCGATPTEAAEIANHASAVVVSKLGTATVTRDEFDGQFSRGFRRWLTSCQLPFLSIATAPIIEDADYCSASETSEGFAWRSRSITAFKIKGIQAHRYYEPKRHRSRAFHR